MAQLSGEEALRVWRTKLKEVIEGVRVGGLRPLEQGRRAEEGSGSGSAASEAAWSKQGERTTRRGGPKGA
eukprot:CAMPEP_0177780728 /NCGR_PEP_ID=MMETSP0491_2-20121128/17402_1 /TAXON_ID=63592 /ORGANISM="Tetraselmis chuii, Strain PLY429" /LENGTH=69 /DNA_ID=CAMNT_0019300607 /DNA_START=89 /DNA_END=298 /DNA_ORIENTATION=+